jgi:hypothetical protein
MALGEPAERRTALPRDIDGSPWDHSDTKKEGGARTN